MNAAPSLPTSRHGLAVLMSCLLGITTLPPGGMQAAEGDAPAPGAVGFTRLNLAPGYTAIGVSLLHLSQVSGKVASPGVSGNVITLSPPAVNVGAQLEAAKQYYVEIVTEGTTALGYCGERFEVDVAATKAGGANRITLRPTATASTMNVVPDLSGCHLVLREHVTLSQVFGGAGRVLMKGTDSSATSDQVLFYDNVTNAYKTYWFRSNAAGTSVSWRSLFAGDTTDYSQLPIHPGVGLLVYRQATAGSLSLIHAGQVRTNPFRLPLPAGLSLISPPVPMTHGPAQAGMVKENGWVGSGSTSTADQAHVWNGTSFGVYWFRANASGSIQEWRSSNSSDTTDHMHNTSLFHGSSSIFVKKLRPDPEYITNLAAP